MAECDFCQSEVEHINKFTDRCEGDPGAKEFEVCDFCYDSDCGNAVRYPDQFRNSSTILAVIAKSHNELLKAIKEKVA